VARALDSAARTETYTGNGAAHIYLKHAPLTALSAMTLTGADGEDTTLTVSGSTPDVTYNEANSRIAFGPDNSCGYAVFPEWPMNNVSVTYTAGYAAGSIPDDVQEAVILYAVTVYAQSSLFMNPALGAQSIGQESRTRIAQSELAAMRSAAEELLTPFKRLSV